MVRRSLIRAELTRSGAVRIRDLAQRLGVSRQTVRRDLRALIAAGDAVGARGGALFPTDRMYWQRTLGHEAVAASAARTVVEHELIGLFGGPMIQALARHLRRRVDLRIVTNALAVAQILASPEPRLGPQVTLLSGALHASGVVYGRLAATSVCELRLDTCYFDCAGFDPDTGATVDDLDDADLRRTSIKVSKRNILLVEPAHLGARGLSSFAAPTDFAAVIDG